MPLPIWLIPIALKGAAVVAGTTGVGVAAHGAKKMKRHCESCPKSPRKKHGKIRERE